MLMESLMAELLALHTKNRKGKLTSAETNKETEICLTKLFEQQIKGNHPKHNINKINK